ncbi:MAG TPA: SfnB family sulfur acquisition oxidoreductase [Solirubrobacterales bacterium]
MSTELGVTAHVIGSDAEALAVAAEFAESIRAGAIERDETRRVPAMELEELARTGLLGITVPREAGGAAVSCSTLTEVFRRIAKADPAIAQVPQNHFYFVDAITRDGSAAQKREFYPALLAGARFGNALSERGGSTPLDFKTTLEPDGEGGFILDGRKYYCTGALTAQWIPVLVRDAQERFVVVYVPRETGGVHAEQDWTAMGQRATVSGTVIFDRVRVPEEWLVPHWKSFEQPQVLGAFGQIMHAAIDVGIAAAALADGAEFIRTRTRAWFESDKDQASADPLILHGVGRLAARLHAVEALLAEAADKIDAAGPTPDAQSAAAASLATAEAKALAVDFSIEICSEIFELAGTSAADAKYDLDRHWRNGRTHSLHDPARWKYVHAGNFTVNGTNPPNHPLI